MNNSSNSLALTMKDAAKLVGVDYRTIKLGIESGTIPTIQLGPRRMIPPRPAVARVRDQRLTRRIRQDSDSPARSGHLNGVRSSETPSRTASRRWVEIGLRVAP